MRNCFIWVPCQLQERVGLRKHQDERLALRSQMSVEEAERTLIEEIKAKEKEKAEVRHTKCATNTLASLSRLSEGGV